ncbi:unnamed protein product [Adineta ricciae]|uniref:F-box domain-containing protein n=1 Tax=Adineta ricciae TaxID=249248 RepID=A0A815MQ22_ADIRI|nr:unnamed protein product [Adineta ricciae]
MNSSEKMQFESLPNDLLLEIFDYLDGIELFRIFPHLNSRFTELLSFYSRYYDFNFQSITKNEMDLVCQESFRENVWKISSLTLSDDDDTPYQTELFFSYRLPFHNFFSLRSLSLYHIRSKVAFYWLLSNLRFFPHFNYLKIDQIDIDRQDIYPYCYSIWSLFALTDLYISDPNLFLDYFLYNLDISVSLKRLHLLEISFLPTEFETLLKHSPSVEELTIEIYQDLDDDDLSIDADLQSTLPLITILNLKFTGYFSGLDHILRLTPHVLKLHIELFNQKIDGYQWQDLICKHLLHLSDFHLKMSFYLTMDYDLEMEVDELVESYQRSYWTLQRQLHFRCLSNLEYNNSEEQYFVLFYSLPYVFDAFKYIKPVYSKSTYNFQAIECESYDTVRILCLVPDDDKPTDEIDERIQFSNLRHLVIGYTFKYLDIFCPKLNFLTILDIQYLDGQVRSHVQTLLNRAPRLQTIIFNKNNWSFFFLASNSVRRLSIRDGIYYNIQQCEQLCSSSLFQQCQVLEINLQKKTSVVDLINRITCLRTLIFQCQCEQWKESPTKLETWFKHYLPSRYLIKRDEFGSFRLSLHYGSNIEVIQDFIQITNTYKSFAERCNGFSNQTDIGYGNCSPLSYETFNTSILCICATNLCNHDLDSCRFSVQNQTQSNSAPVSLPALLPRLQTSISCVNSLFSQTDTVNTTYYCANSHSPYINLTACIEYYRANTVLCVLILQGNGTLAVGLSEDEYRLILLANIQNIHYFDQYSGVSVAYNQSSSYFYVIYKQIIDSSNETYIQQVCFCAQDNCTSNMTSCLNANRSLTVTNNVHNQCC